MRALVVGLCAATLLACDAGEASIDPPVPSEVEPARARVEVAEPEPEPAAEPEPEPAAEPEPNPPPVFVEAEPAAAPTDTRYSVKLHPPIIRGDIDRAVLERYVKRKRADLARCAQKGQGSVEVRYLIGDHGKLMNAALKSSTAPAAASDCVVAKIRGWTDMPRIICNLTEVEQRFELIAEAQPAAPPGPR